MSQISEMLSTYRQARHRLMGSPPKVPPPKLRRIPPKFIVSPPKPRLELVPAPPPPTPDQMHEYRAGQVLTINRIQRIVADHFDVTRADILGPERFNRFVWPRQVSVYIAKKLIPSLSLPELGRRFGKRDHTTMLYALRTVSRRIADSHCDAMEIFACEQSILNGCED